MAKRIRAGPARWLDKYLSQFASGPPSSSDSAPASKSKTCQRRRWPNYICFRSASRPDLVCLFMAHQFLESPIQHRPSRRLGALERAKFSELITLVAIKLIESVCSLPLNRMLAEDVVAKFTIWPTNSPRVSGQRRRKSSLCAREEKTR